MQELKEILGEELFTQVSTKLGDKKLILDNGNFIPKHRFDEVSTKVSSLQEVIKKNEDDLKALKKSAEGNEELTKQISELQKQNKEQEKVFTEKELKQKKLFAVKESLLDAGVSDAEARDVLIHKFDIEKLELDDKGKPKGFDELIKPLKENPSFKGMFGEEKFSGQQHQTGKLDASLGEWASKNPFSKATMNLTQQIELRRTNPELAKKLELAAQ